MPHLSRAWSSPGAKPKRRGCSTPWTGVSPDAPALAGQHGHGTDLPLAEQLDDLFEGRLASYGDGVRVITSLTV
ncbi:hypothetical protein OG588_46380 [Streptomyces prunicolor]|uniref:hypothetical protein n=1 Tax=Streptomyces prunicolor TaxID=67348 RepID=UPI00386C5ECC|nr:hypothetical protein OG588_46380 [Streptomyces prunicolor]